MRTGQGHQIVFCPCCIYQWKHWWASYGYGLVSDHFPNFMNFLNTSCDLIQTSMTACAQFQHPKKPWHMSFSTASCSASCAEVCHVFHHITEHLPEELGSVVMSHITICGIKRFNFRVVHPLCALLSKNLLILWTFPVSYPCFTILSSYFCLFLICNQSAVLPFLSCTILL